MRPSASQCVLAGILFFCGLSTAHTTVVVAGRHEPLRADDRSTSSPRPSECGTSISPRERLRALQLVREGAYKTPPRPRAPVFIPVSVHIVHHTDGSGGIPMDQICQGMRDLNTVFADTGVVFYVQDPLLSIADEAFDDGVSTTGEITWLLTMLRVPNTINLYLAPDLSIGGTPICGRAYFTFSTTQGIVIRNDCFGTPDNPSTFPHEVGHYFNLFHTHEIAFGAECVDGSNCALAGDLLCDTPADPRLTDLVSAACEYLGDEVDTCTGQPFEPSTVNIMSYAPKPCRTVLTPQQRDRMLATLFNLRPELIRTSASITDDCDDNGVIDACDPDCNGNGVPDTCEIAAGLATDENCNGVSDACEIDAEPSLDENENGRIDAMYLCIGETNCDGVVDAVDLQFVVAHLGTDEPRADLDQDGMVWTSDYLLCILRQGAVCN